MSIFKDFEEEGGVGVEEAALCSVKINPLKRSRSHVLLDIANTPAKVPKMDIEGALQEKQETGDVSVQGYFPVSPVFPEDLDNESYRQSIVQHDIDVSIPMQGPRNGQYWQDYESSLFKVFR